MSWPNITIGAVFKNESHILHEWLHHYINQGIQHFILIDNGSSDSPLEILQPFIDQNLVHYIYDPVKHDQIGKYNKHIFRTTNSINVAVPSDFNWIILLDLDEFLYARFDLCINKYLMSIPEDVGQVSVPWKLFGSSGHIDQPSSVISNFCQRQAYHQSTFANFKSIVRTPAIDSFGIHEHKLKAGWKHIDCLGRLMADIRPKNGPTTCLIPINEVLLQDMPLHLNHYAIQSLKWFRCIKMTRGSANCVLHDKIRNERYFKEYDHNERLDDELKLLTEHKDMASSNIRTTV